MMSARIASWVGAETMVGMFAPLALLGALFVSQSGAEDLAPLPPSDAPNTEQLDAKQVALGRALFFDTRLSGDATISCATCHDPNKQFTDGLALSKGYPGTLYFRNTPTIINAQHQRYFYWDGRMSADDMPSMIRDHIAESHFMQADGRLVIERLRQVPQYEEEFESTFGGEPSYGRILNAVSAFVRSIGSTDAPIDRFLRGDKTAISVSAQRGLELFRGKANCVQCHHGPMFNDEKFHHLGLPTNPDIFSEPERHITFRRFFRTLGISDYAALRYDIGCACTSKQDDERGHFRTASLREVAGTAPYMHDGSLATLEDVIDFYDRGGGTADQNATFVSAQKDSRLKPLQLTAQEKSDLLDLLKTFSGTQTPIEPIPAAPYALRTLGEN